MALAPPSPEVPDFVTRVAQAYSGLIASPHADSESALGGKFFYGGKLDNAGRVLLVAANIAGSATLVATADRADQKQAIRDGVADFLITSLDEALRILKNQLRKRETVSVCVAIESTAMELEMNERGVQPDLLRSTVNGGPSDGAKLPALMTWRVATAPAHWLPQLDAIALECLDADAWGARRWLRFAPRYLGRMAEGNRSIACSQRIASSFIERVQNRVEGGDISVQVEIRWRDPRGKDEKHTFEPAKP